MFYRMLRIYSLPVMVYVYMLFPRTALVTHRLIAKFFEKKRLKGISSNQDR